MLLANVVETSRGIAATGKRLEKTDLLAQLLRQLAPEEAEITVAFLSGSVRQGRIGVGYSTIQSAKGEPASEATLQIADADTAFSNFAAVRGAGADSRRREILRSLMSRATAEEQHFIARLLTGELRQGALEGIMVDALAKASNVPVERVRRAAMMAGGIPALAHSVLERGDEGLDQFELRLFRPAQPMLAQPAEDVAEALSELGEASLEYKFDGARVQVHKSGDEVAVFSRNMNDVSSAVPEVLAAARALPAHDLILDGEVLSFDRNGRPLPFQVSMRRFGRKSNDPALGDELPLTPYWFDLLHLNGNGVLDEPQSRRFAELRRLVPAEHLVPQLTTGEQQEAEDFLHQALGAGHEGIMAKSLSAPYAAGARGQSWLKVKRARTLDLVILAAEWGNGRRQGFLSNLHLGARDTEQGGFAMLGKTFKGLTDEMLAWQTAELLRIEIGRDRWAVHVEPKVVVEVAFNEIQVSTRYKSGLALRFARVKRYRPDKTAAESDTFQTVKHLAGMTA